jgi:hypothetical protein
MASLSCFGEYHGGWQTKSEDFTPKLPEQTIEYISLDGDTVLLLQTAGPPGRRRMTLWALFGGYDLNRERVMRVAVIGVKRRRRNFS